MNLTSLVSLLPALACPVGMGLVMWLMTRGSKEQAAGAGTADRLASLRAELGEVEAQQASLAARLDRLGADDPPVPAAEAAPVTPARRLA